MTNINTVVIEGMIVHKFVTDKVAIVTVNTGNASIEPNYPKIIFFGDEIGNIDKNFNKNDYVKVTGNIQSSRLKPNIKNQNTVSIFGESIEKATDIIKEKIGIESNTAIYRYMNEFQIAGKVINIEQAYDNLIRIKIYTNKNGRPSYVPVVYYTNTPEKIMNEIKKDDEVAVIGCVQTVKKFSHEKEIHYENYVVTEIAKQK